MEGWWDVEKLDEFFFRIFRSGADQRLRHSLPGLMNLFWAWIINNQGRSRAFAIGKRHYDIGNDLYTRMLGESMAYSCGYWKEAHSLKDAQWAKLDLVAQKIGLKPKDKVLDIGCGWGSFLGKAAKDYGARATGITVSEKQARYSRKWNRGLNVKTFVRDYRSLRGRYDHVISIGMFEHVGVKNYRTFMKKVHDCLKDDGLFLLHTIGRNRSTRITDPWISKYIFPNSMLPSAEQITKAAEGLFIIEDWHNFSVYYDKTLICWFQNFEKAWPELREKYGDKFYRMWKLYLLSSAACFRARKNQLWQIVFSKKGVLGGYDSIR